MSSNNINNIPQALHDLNQWVVWKKDKKPRNARTGALASVANPSTWSTYEEACDAVKKKKALGVGFVFTDDDPYAGIDLDHVIDNDGHITPYTQDIIDRFDSYTETSQSDHGIHIIIWGKKPKGSCKTKGIEVYDQGRYFALTGNIYQGRDTIQERQEELDALFIETFGGSNEPTPESQGEPIQEGQRNSTLLSLAGSMRHKGMTAGEIESALMVVNQGRCQPPLEEKEVLAIVKSVSRYEPATNVHRSDTGNATMLVDEYGDTLRYDHKRKRWLRWGKHRWEINYDGHISRLAQKIARERYSRAAAIKDLGEREKEAKWAIASEHRAKIDGCVALVKTTEPVTDDGTNWDRDTMLLGAPNGVIDLCTGDLRGGKAEDRITMSIGAVFDPSAECPLWIKFLDRVTDGNIELQKYLQRAVGYSLTGDTKSQVLFFLYGMGNNGKSTFIITIRKLLADYGCRAGMDLFMLKDRTSGGPKESLANLENKRFVSASEIEEGRRLAVSLIKDMTGGETIVADRKFQHEVEYQPQYKVWLAGNHKPTISDTTLSIWRRVKLIPFVVTIPDSEIDHDLPANLEKELSGIFNWAIEGCLEWQRSGLGEPEAVTESTKEYRQEQDTFSRFIEDKCIEGSEETARAGQAYTSYRMWAKGEGIGKFEMLTQTGFGIKMGERYKRKKSPRGQIYIGVRLKNPMITLNMTED